MTHLHAVPACSRQIDPGEWARCGGLPLGDAAAWSGRAAGMACLRMILLAYLGDAPPLAELLVMGARAGALSRRHPEEKGIARMASRFGVPAASEAIGPGDLPARLKEAPVIVPVTEGFPGDSCGGNRFVVASGFGESSEDGPDIFFRDPSYRCREYRVTRLKQMEASYAGPCVTFAPLDSGPGLLPDLAGPGLRRQPR